MRGPTPKKSLVIQGLEQVQHRLTTLDFMFKPTGSILRDWKEEFRKEAYERAPDWKGDTKRAIQTAQDTKRFPLWARVFSDAPQSRWMEYGTGLLSEDPRSAHRRYRPPEEAVQEWAEDHNMEADALAQLIWTRGGTPPTHFFSDAELAADRYLIRRLPRFGKDIEYAAEHV